MAFEAFPPGGILRLDNLISELKERLAQLEAIVGDEAMREYVDAWLEAHPEATTTVQDHSVTAEKLAVQVTYTVTDGDLTISLT